MVFKEPVLPSGEPGEAIHRPLHNPRARGIEWIHRLARLKIDIGILRRAAQHRMIRRERPRAMLPHALIVDHRPDRLLREQRDLGDLVRGAKTIEEEQERDARLERGRLRDEREIMRFLHARRAEHRKAGPARRHHIAVIAEDRERLHRERPCRDVQHERRQLARDFEHVRQHQQQPLRSRECRRQRPRLKRPVDRPRGTSFTLHFDHRRHSAPQIPHPGRRPLVSPFAHRRRGRDRIKCDDFVQLVSDARDGFVAVES